MAKDFQLRFYADTPQGKNQRLYWPVTGRAQAIRRLKYCTNKKWIIRAAWCYNVLTQAKERLV